MIQMLTDFPDNVVAASASVKVEIRRIHLSGEWHPPVRIRWSFEPAKPG